MNDPGRHLQTAGGLKQAIQGEWVYCVYSDIVSISRDFGRGGNILGFFQEKRASGLTGILY